MAAKSGGISATILIHDGANGYVERTLDEVSTIGDSTDANSTVPGDRPQVARCEVRSFGL